MMRKNAAPIVLALAVSLIAGLPAAGAAGGPRIAELEYYEDLEDGRRHNVVATIKGNADKASARIGKVRSNGRESGHIGPGGKGKSWFFRERRFVKAVRGALASTGTARVRVKAKLGDDARRKVCTLEFEPDPTFGDYATGDCRKR